MRALRLGLANGGFGQRGYGLPLFQQSGWSPAARVQLFRALDCAVFVTASWRATAFAQSPRLPPWRKLPASGGVMKASQSDVLPPAPSW